MLIYTKFNAARQPGLGVCEVSRVVLNLSLAAVNRRRAEVTAVWRGPDRCIETTLHSPGASLPVPTGKGTGKGDRFILGASKRLTRRSSRPLLTSRRLSLAVSWFKEERGNNNG